MRASEEMMWVVEWQEPYALDPSRMRTEKKDFLRLDDAQAYMNESGLPQQTLKRAPFARRLEAWLKMLRKNGIRSRKNVSYAAMSKMNPDAPTVFHTGYQGCAYEAWGDEVYRKSSGEAVRILYFNHDNLTPQHYDALRILLDAYGLPYGWDGTDMQSIQIITPHGELMFHVCDFCEEIAQGSYSVHVGEHRMCKACQEVNE